MSNGSTARAHRIDAGDVFGAGLYQRRASLSYVEPANKSFIINKLAHVNGIKNDVDFRNRCRCHMHDTAHINATIDTVDIVMLILD